MAAEVQKEARKARKGKRQLQSVVEQPADQASSFPSLVAVSAFKGPQLKTKTAPTRL